ncbi:MAG: ABC transporter ATP-binding protein [Nanoarchaeota archaeon]|nr:ABC transporter ATP-binding protein [Nanoarchaeota archaeon]
MSKDNKIAIELKNVWKTYYLGENVVHALKGLSFSVKKGEFLAIIGKSGSGKTTAVNQIGCLDIPSQGDVILDGVKISSLTESELAVIRGKKIGYIFQKFNLIKTLSAVENVELPMIFQGTSKIERKEKAQELLTKFDMADKFINKPSELSGGQQQRVAIARALANEPEIILADEPTGNLDSKTGIIVMEYLKKLHTEGKTIILVTHDDKLSNYAHKIITLVDGKVISEKINKNPL